MSTTIIDPKHLRRWHTVGQSCYMAISIEKYRVIRDLLATCILGYLAFQGIAPSIAVTFIGIINTITLSELYKAIREVQRHNRDMSTTDD